MTVTSTDPRFVTPTVKAMLLRRENQLVRAGRIEKADAVAKQIRAVITRKESAWLRNLNTRHNPKVAWAKVRELTKGEGRENSSVVEGLTSQILNDFYASIFTDSLYRRPLCKHTAVCPSYGAPSLPPF